MNIRIGQIIGCAALSAVGTLACAAEPWCAAPLEKWTEARTLDSCTEAARVEGPPTTLPSHGRWPVPVPQPPFGTWRVQDGMLSAVGLTHRWSTMLMPGERNGAEISTRFTVLKSSGASRQLPGGCVRWGFHWGENLPGWDVGVVLGYRDPLNFYRVQLSAARGELALWDATGGFLQLIPCAVEIGKPHDLTVRWRDGHMVADLDGKTVMDYWDRTLPYDSGRIGLAVWKSEVQVERFEAADPEWRLRRKGPPPHRPDFRFEPSGGLLEGHPSFHLEPYEGVILFDGYEPISCFFKFPDNGKLYHAAVKLKPGWRSAYFNYIGPRLDDGGEWPPLAGELPEAFAVTKTGPTLEFSFRMDHGETGHTDHECVVRFDDRRGVYRYEFRGRLHIVNDCKANVIEICDPLTYNNRSPGPDVVHRWNPAGHRWWVFEGADGPWQRMPIVDDWRGDRGLRTKWGKSLDFLYPDPVACPAFETELGWAQRPGQKYVLGQCLWGYDYHHRITEAGFKAGEERTWTMTFTALPPPEAQRLFETSGFAEDHRPLAQIPFMPFDPTGTTFEHTTTLADPSTTMCWMGGVRDDTVGHGDTYSLRIDGPGTARVFLYQYMIEQVAPAWQVSGWVKTKDLAGKGVTLRVKYSYGKQYVPEGVCGEETFDLGGAGSRDWTAFSVVTTVPRVQDATDILFQLDGKGSAWIDDVAISALADGQQPAVTTTAGRQ